MEIVPKCRLLSMQEAERLRERLHDWPEALAHYFGDCDDRMPFTDTEGEWRSALVRELLTEIVRLQRSASKKTGALAALQPWMIRMARVATDSKLSDACTIRLPHSWLRT